MEALILLIVFISGYIIKDYLPSYMKKKGENLATKEDIKKITELQEQIKAEIVKHVDDYNRNSKFRMDLQYKRYDELYSIIYKNICLSEFYRIFIKENSSYELSFEEAPFIDMDDKTDTYFSLLNKNSLCEYILSHANLASTQLLKVAVAYKYIYENIKNKKYKIEDSLTGEKKDITEYTNTQELRLLKEMIEIIIKEHNELVNELNLNFKSTQVINNDFSVFKTCKENS